MEHYVAYHKIADYGAYPFDMDEFMHYSGKSETVLRKIIGKRIWVISGGKENSKMTYRLVSTYVSDSLEREDLGTFLVKGKGEYFAEPGIRLNEYPWLETLLKEQNNFRFGINAIRDQAIIDGLETIRLEESRSTSTVTQFYEGECKQVTRNSYERNREARNEALKHYGYTCAVCGFDFEKQYGELGHRFIHVHHLTPVANQGQVYQIDPVRDLRPVCPNCHAILHKRQPPYSIEELRALVRHPFSE